MADEKINGAPNGHRAPPSPAELRRDETSLVARFHRDAAEILDHLRIRTEQVADLVEAFGHVDCREIRHELQRATRLGFRLLGPQFADLKGTP